MTPVPDAKPGSEAVSTRTIGNYEVSVIHAGYIHWKPTFYPGDWTVDSAIDRDSAIWSSPASVDTGGLGGLQLV